jgi:long-subunit acyl-CoA synthetase (AMP-forming)
MSKNNPTDCLAELAGPGPHKSLLNSHLLQQDPPDHTRLRKLVAKAFTARSVQKIRPDIVGIADKLLDRMAVAAAAGHLVDLVQTYAVQLPLQVIGELPYPRGELLVKTDTLTPGYCNCPTLTAQVFDVAVANLESIYAGAPLVRQIFVYGNSQQPSLLAVIVPAPVALAEYGNSTALKAALHQSLQQTAAAQGLQSYEVPVDFVIETDPFTDENGLFSGVGKLLRSRLKEHYGERLEQMYTEIATAQVNEIRVLR